MRSFRTRITLWNTVVIALVLGAFGYLLIQVVSSNARASIDRELRERARPFQVAPPPPGQGFGGAGGQGGQGGAGGGGGVGAAGSPGAGPLAQGGFGQGGPLAQAPGQQGPGPFREPPIGRRPEYRPRVIFANGQVEREPEGTGPYDEEAFRQALTGKELYSNVTSNGVKLRVFSAPRRGGPNIVAVVQTARPVNELELMEANMARTLLMLIPVALIVAALGGMFLSARVLKPVEDVTAAASNITETDLSRRLKVVGDDELARMAGTFNSMLDRLEGSFKSREDAYAKLKEAFEQQKRFTSDASHELRTPLARIKVSTSSALNQEQSPAEYRQALQIADAAADTMDRLISQLLELARADAGALNLQLVAMPVEELLDEVRQLAARFQDHQIEVRPLGASAAITADRHSLMRVFDNLLQNAVRHTPPGKRIEVQAAAEGPSVVFQVMDEGEGIPAEALPHLFERFYRADTSRTRESGGTGLGLSIVQSIVAAHHGTVEIVSELGNGATVRLIFPRTS